MEPGSEPPRPVPRGTAAYPRKRAVTACQVCRARRTKCDNKKPSCSFCLTVGARCIQASVDLSSFDPASLKILDRLSEIEIAVRKCQASIEALVETQRRAPSDVSALRPTPPDFRDLEDRSRRLPPPIETICRWPFLNVPKIMGAQEGSVGIPSSVYREAPIPLDNLDHRLVQPLVDRFFHYVHVKNPILDESQTRRLVAHYCVAGLDWSAESCLVLLVVALGATATQPQKRLGLTLEGGDRVLEAQCFFLSGVFAITTMQRDTAWRFFLHALACCQQFQFIADQGAEHALPGIDTFYTGESTGLRSLTIEQTVYWSVWKSEREVHGEIQSPDFTLSQGDLTTCPQFFPTPPENGDYAYPKTHTKDHDWEQLSWYFYLSEISLRRLASCIANRIFQLDTAGESILEVLSRATCIYESQVEEWAPFVDAFIHGSLMDGDWILLRALVRKGLQKHMERLRVNEIGYRHRHHGTLFLLRNCTRSTMVLVAAALAIQHQLDQRVNPDITMPLGWRQAVFLALEMNRYWEAESVDSRYLARILRVMWEKVEELNL
ncbi:C6 zinc finger domain protein [Aspergillus cavernicola]|uniref:C6 zinc finger domain protein n=1 Tax=Aspergillus cavernicola TaxID=176166 RepID=A0ABR4INV2_9EURO